MGKEFDYSCLCGDDNRDDDDLVCSEVAVHKNILIRR